MAKSETANTNSSDEAAKAAPTKDWLIVDLNAKRAREKRGHEQLIDGFAVEFTFDGGKPTALPKAIAMKFLRDEAFVRVDEAGALVPYQRLPKQPDQLGAGQQFVLADSETIARLDELTLKALLQRAIILPGGEVFANAKTRPSEAEVIEFLIAQRKRAALANSAPDDRAADEFDPGEEVAA